MPVPADDQIADLALDLNLRQQHPCGFFCRLKIADGVNFTANNFNAEGPSE